jgi:hypothetical protein
MNIEDFNQSKEDWIQHIRKLKKAGFRSYELLAVGYDSRSIWEVYVNEVKDDGERN